MAKPLPYHTGVRGAGNRSARILSDQNLGGGRRLIRGTPGMEEAAKASRDVRVQFDRYMKGEITEAEARAFLKERFGRYMQEKMWPAANGNPERVNLRIKYRSPDGHEQWMFWSLEPPHSSPTLLGVCPACFVQAPTTVNANNGTKPVFVDKTLHFLQQDKEADKKWAAFMVTSRTHKIFYDWSKGETRGKASPITVRERIRCDNAARCGWIVQLENGVASKVERNLITRGRGGAIKGPLIIVK